MVANCPLPSVPFPRFRLFVLCQQGCPIFLGGTGGWSGLWVGRFGLTLLYTPRLHGQYQVFTEFNYNSLKFYRHYQLVTLKIKLPVIVPATMGLLENERELQSRTNKAQQNHRQDQGTKERHAFLRRKGVGWEGCYELNKSPLEETGSFKCDGFSWADLLPRRMRKSSLPPGGEKYPCASSSPSKSISSCWVCNWLRVVVYDSYPSWNFWNSILERFPIFNFQVTISHFSFQVTMYVSHPEVLLNSDHIQVRI